MEIRCARCGRKLRNYVVLNGKYYGKYCVSKILNEIQPKLDKWFNDFEGTVKF